MKKKAIIFIIIAVILVAGIASCSTTGDSGSGNSETSSSTTEEKNDLVLDGEISSYNDDVDWIHFEGVIKNNSEKEMSYVEIEVILYDENDTQIGTALDNTTTLKAGGTWKFDATCLDNISSYDHFDYTISGY